jgi:hypothetical protein
MQGLNIDYREFFDVPRIFVTHYEGRTYLFDCPFDDTRDDYPETYSVYELPDLTDAQRRDSWTRLSDLATSVVGTIPVHSVRFDSTQRLKIDEAVFSQLFAQHSSPVA